MDYEDRWWRAMDKAERLGLAPEQLDEHTYRVASTSSPGTYHVVTTDAAGRINGCSDCKGAEIFFSALHDDILKTPCAHCGAVARLLISERRVPFRRRVAA